MRNLDGGAEFLRRLALTSGTSVGTFRRVFAEGLPGNYIRGACTWVYCPGGWLWDLRGLHAVGAVQIAPEHNQIEGGPKISALGEKKLLYIRVCYPDEASEPITAAEAGRLMGEVNEFYRTQSYGKFKLVSTVTPLLMLPLAKTNYFPESDWYWDAYMLLDNAREAARKAGYDPADYDLDAVRFNAPFQRSFGLIGESGLWMTSSDAWITSHEIGHNLGLQHANRWSGPLNGPGANVEYGDQFDIMGLPTDYQLVGFHFLNKRALGWLSDVNVTRPSSSGVFRLYAHDGITNVLARPYALRVRKDDERDYWIEKRQAFWLIFDQSGLLAYWDAWSGSLAGTQIIDPLGTKETLPIGAPLDDPVVGVKILPIEQSPDLSYVDVAIIFGISKINLLGDWLHFSGDPDRSYSFQFSSELRTWTEFARKSSASGELIAKIERDQPRAFYRVVAAPERM